MFRFMTSNYDVVVDAQFHKLSKRGSFLVPQIAQALGDGGALVSYGGMSLRPITLPAAFLQVGGGGCCRVAFDARKY